MSTMEESTNEFAVPPIAAVENLILHVSWYAYGDRLMVSFRDEPSPGMNVAIGDGSIELRVTLDEDELLGFEIPNFVHAFLPAHPEFLDFAATAGVPGETIERLRAQVSTREQQQCAIKGLLRQFVGVELSL